MKNKYDIVARLNYDILHTYSYLLEANDYADDFGVDLEELAQTVAKAFKAKDYGSGAGFGVRDISFGGFKTVEDALLFGEYLQDCTDGYLHLDEVTVSTD